MKKLFTIFDFIGVNCVLGSVHSPRLMCTLLPVLNGANLYTENGRNYYIDLGCYQSLFSGKLIRTYFK